MLEELKLLLDITTHDKDNLLNLLLDMAQNEAIDYTGAPIDKLNTVILKIAVFNYNRLGTEGLNSENYSGVTFNYDNDYPDSIKTQLDSLAKHYKNGMRILW